MALRPRFALWLFAFAIFPACWLFPQEAPAKKPADGAAPEQPCPDSNAKFARTHCEALSCVQKVLYFSNVSQPTELQDVVNAIRALAEIQRIQQVIGAQIIIVEGTAEQVTMAEKLAAEIDAAKRRFGGLGYRIDFRIQESEGDKKVRSHLYSFTTEAHQEARVSLGRPAPVPIKTESGSETKQPPEPSSAGSVECRVIAEHEHTLELNVETGFTSDAANEPGGGAPPLDRITTHVTVELDKPTVIGRIDDPNSDRSYAIELTATRIKEK